MKIQKSQCAIKTAVHKETFRGRHSEGLVHVSVGEQIVSLHTDMV